MEQNSTRNSQAERAGIVGIITNVLLAVGKLIAGILSQSMSIISDALNNFSDGISAVVTTIGFKLAKKPADNEHPFGHARFEYVASLIIAFIILFVGFELAISSIEKIITPTPTVFSILSIAILCVSMFIKLALSIYDYKIYKKLKSETFKAAAIDCRNDIIVTFFVLVAMVIEKLYSVQVDGYVGLLVSLFIAYSGIKLTKETISPILGNTNNEELKDKILAKIKEYPMVIGYHDLMIHDYGPGASFCSIHFEIDKNLDPLRVHELIDKFEREFLSQGVSLTVHYDPVVTNDEELNRLKNLISSAINEISPSLSLHDFRYIPCDGFTKIFFDIPIPDQSASLKEKILSAVENALGTIKDKKYLADITFDSISFN